jgi:hypothetical protein
MSEFQQVIWEETQLANGHGIKLLPSDGKHTVPVVVFTRDGKDIFSTGITKQGIRDLVLALVKQL